MSRLLTFRIYSTDESDLDWLQSRIHGVILDEIDEQNERIDGDVTVTWEYEDT